MTWEPAVVREYSHCEQWDTLIGGLRWYRWKTAQGTFFAFEPEDASLLGADGDAQYDSTEFKTAENWRSWDSRQPYGARTSSPNRKPTMAVPSRSSRSRQLLK